MDGNAAQQVPEEVEQLGAEDAEALRLARDPPAWIDANILVSELGALDGRGRTVCTASYLQHPRALRSRRRGESKQTEQRSENGRHATHGRSTAYEGATHSTFTVCGPRVRSAAIAAHGRRNHRKHRLRNGDEGHPVKPPERFCSSLYSSRARQDLDWRT